MSAGMKRMICRPHLQDGRTHVEFTFESDQGAKTVIDRICGRKAIRLDTNVRNEYIEVRVDRKPVTLVLTVFILFTFRDGTKRLFEEDFSKDHITFHFGPGGLN